MLSLVPRMMTTPSNTNFRTQLHYLWLGKDASDHQDPSILRLRGSLYKPSFTRQFSPYPKQNSANQIQIQARVIAGILFADVWSLYSFRTELCTNCTTAGEEWRRTGRTDGSLSLRGANMDGTESVFFVVFLGVKFSVGDVSWWIDRIFALTRNKMFLTLIIGEFPPSQVFTSKCWWMIFSDQPWCNGCIYIYYIPFDLLESNPHGKPWWFSKVSL